MAQPLAKEYSADEHLLTIHQLCERYATIVNSTNIDKSTGLTTQLAKEKLNSDGRNVLTPPKSKPEWLKLLLQFTNLFLVLLEVASVLSFISYGLVPDPNNLILGVALIFLVILTAVMNYYQEKSASNVINSIKNMLPSMTQVIRDGKEFQIPAEELVKGDIVHLTIGNRVPADIRILEASDFKVEMSSLTGESDAIECTSERKSDIPAEARNLIFNSTLVMSGECYGMVVKTGDETMIGSISKLAGTTTTSRTTMETEVLRLVHFITTLALITAFTFFGIGMGRNLGFVFSFVNAFILVLIANVPEGLPATVTSILNLTAQRLAKHKVLIKRTDLIETLGSASVICSDKTGTLTQNKMTVTHMWYNQKFVDAKGDIHRVEPGKSASVPNSPRIIPKTGGSTGLVGFSVREEEAFRSMTIGRKMSFLELASGDAAAIIHATSNAAHAHLNTNYMVANNRTLSTGSPSSPSYNAQGSIGSFGTGSIGSLTSFPLKLVNGRVEASSPTISKQGSLRFIAPSQLTLNRTLNRSSKINGNSVKLSNNHQMTAPSLLSIFPSASFAASAEMIIPEPIVLSQLEVTPMEETSEILIEEETESATKTEENGANINHEKITAKDSEKMEDRSNIGATGNELIVSGFIASSSSSILTSVPTMESKSRESIVSEREIRIETMRQESQDTNKTAIVVPNHKLPFQSTIAFQSFRNFSKVSWGAANAFTRLCTIAAVCNQARFSNEDNKLNDTVEITIPLPNHEKSDGKSSSPKASSSPTLTAIKEKARTVLSGDQTKENEKVIAKETMDHRKILGDATSAALLRYVDALVPIQEWRTAYPVVYEIPFNSVTKWSATITVIPEDPSHHLLFVKGAPERVIDRCSYHFENGNEILIDDDYRTEWAAAYERFGILGERVLGFAYSVIDARTAAEYKRIGINVQGKETMHENTSKESKGIMVENLVFAGLISLVDPPKDGVAEAVKKCKDASIRVTMVTGDHPLTAESIARQVGIITKPTAAELAVSLGVDEVEIPLADPRVQAIVLPGYALPNLSEADWEAVLEKAEVVFARTSPQQKLQIVQHYQRLGHIVAVTGDGTNDAPALKAAQIGVSMGSESASDVAREAADMILMDDNFASIVFAIEMGRTVFDNIKKTVAYTVAHLWPELIPIFVTLVFDVPIMLSGLFILLIDLVTEQGPAISLSYEPAESSVMSRPPRNLKTQRLVDAPLVLYSYLVIGIAESLTCVLAYFTIFLYYNIPISYVAYHPELWMNSSPDLVLPQQNNRTIPGSEQFTIYKQGVSAYFLTLVLCQGWHIWFCKTRLVSLFSHPIFHNRTTLYGLGVTLSITIAAIYIPGLNIIFSAYTLPGYWWLPQFIFAICGLGYTEGYKYCARNYPNGFIARNFAW